MKKQAFTLVELIVVITILAILGTIAFISIQNYSSQSRDTVRISDLSSTKKALEVYKLKQGYYPTPTNGTGVTYTGETIWTQGTLGDTVLQEIKNLSNIPLDPLTNTQYTYSVLNTKKEYQLGGILENSDSLSLNTITQTNASGSKLATAIIVGNYNGQIAQVEKGTTTYVLAIPTIISGDITLREINDLIDQNKLVYNGYSNLPATYKNTDFKTDGAVDLVLITDKTNLELYSGDLEILEDNEQERVQLLKKIELAYSGTELQEKGIADRIIKLRVNETNPSKETKDEAIEVVELLFKTNISNEQKAATSNCNTGYHDEGSGCEPNTRLVSITNGTGSESWNGSDWDSMTVYSCDIDYYNSGDNTCSSVGNGYYSDNTSISRVSCTNKPDDSIYDGSGLGSNSCSWSCDLGFIQNGNSCDIISGNQTFISNGTFTVPNGVYEVTICMVGGGGGGSFNVNPHATYQGGGYAGQVVNTIVSVVPGNSISVTVGNGGVGKSFGNGNGSAGGQSSFGGVIASGGAGGIRGGNYKGNLAVRTTCGGTFNDGRLRSRDAWHNRGGQSSGFGNGGSGDQGNGAGNSGDINGGIGSGGGGASADNSYWSTRAGNGGRGEVRITWGQ